MKKVVSKDEKASIGSSMVSEKEKALEAAISQIQKQFGKGSIMKLGETTETNISTIPTGSKFSIALGVGGIPRGRIIKYLVRIFR